MKIPACLFAPIDLFFVSFSAVSEGPNQKRTPGEMEDQVPLFKKDPFWPMPHEWMLGQVVPPK